MSPTLVMFNFCCWLHKPININGNFLIYRISTLTLSSLPIGLTPLHVAAQNGHHDVIKQLVNTKADVNIQDSKSGKTALHYSIERGDLPLSGYLVTEVCVCVCACMHACVRACVCACIRRASFRLGGDLTLRTQSALLVLVNAVTSFIHG